MSLNHSRWFSFADFLLSAISCIALSLRPQWGWWPLVLASLPWIIRIFLKGLPFRKTPFNLLILIFLLSAFVGLWAAYDQERAFHKFSLIIGAVFLFYSIANQPASNLWLISICLGLWGVLTNIVFLLITDWAVFSADIGIIDQAGQWWIGVRPNLEILESLNIHLFHPNIVGGINAVLLPLSVASLVHFWHKKNGYLIAFSGLILLFICLGFVLSSSRAAWGAALIGLGFLATLNKSAIRRFLTRKYILVLLPMFIVLIGVIAPVILAEIFSGSVSPLTDVTSFSSRITIARDTFFLIGDFPFTGGGLGSFPGLYSEYLLVIPFFMFSYSHNLYLDLVLEQGLAGFLFWAGMVFVCSITLKSAIKIRPIKLSTRLFATAAYASLIVLLIHGIADDSIYSNVWGLPFLFLLPGLSVAASPQDQIFAIPKNNLRAGAVVLVIFLGLVAWFAKPILASGYANIGSVEMAKSTLADWPTGEWETTSISDPGGHAEKYFVKAASLNNTNRTANHRLGLILMSQQAFEEASNYLESAHLSAPGHRGIRKSLGYCYTWLGEFEKAVVILEHTPEAKPEMEAYIGWWQFQGRDDLAAKALLMAQSLETK